MCVRDILVARPFAMRELFTMSVSMPFEISSSSVPCDCEDNDISALPLASREVCRREDCDVVIARCD